MKKLLRYCSILPAVFMLFLIFGFSAQDGAASGSLSFRVSYTAVRVASRLFSLDFTREELLHHADSIGLLVRKTAHITEYFLLTLSLYWPLRMWLPQKAADAAGRRKAFLTCYLLPTFLLAVFFAAFDEFHQSFVPGRCGTPVDVLVDSIGIFIGCIVLMLCHHYFQTKHCN